MKLSKVLKTVSSSEFVDVVAEDGRPLLAHGLLGAYTVSMVRTYEGKIVTDIRAELNQEHQPIIKITVAK